MYRGFGICVCVEAVPWGRSVVSCEGATRRVCSRVNGGRGVVSTTRYTAHLHLIVDSGSGTSGRCVRGVRNMGNIFFTRKRVRVVLKANMIGGMCSRFVQVTKISRDDGRRLGGITTSETGPIRELVGALKSVFIPVVPTVITDNFLVKVVRTLGFVMGGKFLGVSADNSVCAFTRLFDGATCAFLPVLVTCDNTGIFNTGPCLNTIVNVVVVRPGLRGT